LGEIKGPVSGGLRRGGRTISNVPANGIEARRRATGEKEGRGIVQSPWRKEGSTPSQRRGMNAGREKGPMGCRQEGGKS